MELKELEYIVAVAEERSISKAADRLYLAQSSLSQFVSRYEAELGVKLFKRTSGGVRPTAAGELFLRNARQMLLQYHQVRKQLTDLDAPMEGRIHFGISTFRGSYLFPKAMKLFRQEAPTVDVILHEHDSIYLQRKIAAGELDMALVAYREDQWDNQGKFLMKDEVLLVANRESPVMEFVREGGGGPDRPWVELSDIAAPPCWGPSPRRCLTIWASSPTMSAAPRRPPCLLPWPAGGWGSPLPIAPVWRKAGM